MQHAKLGLALIFFFSSFFARSTKIDSIKAVVTPVQCYGLRNGMIHVDTVYGGVKPYSFSLDGQTFSTNPTFDLLWAGDYTLYVRDASGNAKNWPFRIQEPPELLVKLVLSDTNLIAGQTLNLRAIASVETDFLQQIEWKPAEIFPKQDTLRQTIRLTEATQFSVVVHDVYGCTASAERSVEVRTPNLYVPNVIRPGSPADAYFTVFTGEGMLRIVTLQVFDRAGSLVFDRHDFLPNAPQMGWGGRVEGQTVPPGVYPYLIVVEYVDGKKLRLEGDVTVVY